MFFFLIFYVVGIFVYLGWALRAVSTMTHDSGPVVTILTIMVLSIFWPISVLIRLGALFYDQFSS